jgi:hypothetical protein
VEVIEEMDIEFEMDDFFKQGGLDVEEMAAPKVEVAIANKTSGNNDDVNEKEDEQDKDTEPDE